MRCELLDHDVDIMGLDQKVLTTYFFLLRNENKLKGNSNVFHNIILCTIMMFLFSMQFLQFSKKAVVTRVK